MTQPALPLRRTTWLPRCRTCANPRRSRARMASSPESCLTLDTCGLECRQQGVFAAFQRELLQVEFRGLSEIGNSLFDGGSLADSASFRALSHPEALVLA